MHRWCTFSWMPENCNVLPVHHTYKDEMILWKLRAVCELGLDKACVSVGLTKMACSTVPSCLHSTPHTCGYMRQHATTTGSWNMNKGCSQSNVTWMNTLQGLLTKYSDANEQAARAAHYQSCSQSIVTWMNILQGLLTKFSDVNEHATRAAHKVQWHEWMHYQSCSQSIVTWMNMLQGLHTK